MSDSEALELKPLIDEVEFEKLAPGLKNQRGLVLGLKYSSSKEVIVNVLYEDENDGYSRTYNCRYLKKI